MVTERTVASGLVIKTEIIVDTGTGLIAGGVGFTVNAFEFERAPGRFHGMSPAEDLIDTERRGGRSEATSAQEGS